MASTALARLLDGPSRPARVVSAGAGATYLAVEGGGLVGVVDREAVRLPCALVVDAAALGPVTGRPAGTRARVGGGGLAMGVGGASGGVAVRPARWWDPRPRLGAVGAVPLAAAVEAAAGSLPPWPGGGVGAATRARLREGRGALRAALAGRSPPAVATGLLVGLGPGSTPSGDDLLAGTLAGARLFGEALDAPGALALAGALWAAARPLLERTPALSAALLAHAARGEVCLPAASLCHALARREPVDLSLERLLAVGHTSGHDLATGLLLGVTAALRHAPVEVRR